MNKKSKLLNEIHRLMQPYRIQAKEVNFGSASKKDSADTLEIISQEYTIKIQVL